jgi:hypothetical protein
MTTNPMFTNLTLDAVAVFRAAYANSEQGRISTDRFLAALPPTEKAAMIRLCAAAQYDCDFSAPVGACFLTGDGWQSRVRFSTCVEKTLKNCSEPGTDLVMVLKLLCATASRLSANIAANSVDVDEVFITTQKCSKCCRYCKEADYDKDRWHSSGEYCTPSLTNFGMCKSCVAGHADFVFIASGGGGSGDEGGYRDMNGEPTKAVTEKERTGANMRPIIKYTPRRVADVATLWMFVRAVDDMEPGLVELIQLFVYPPRCRHYNNPWICKYGACGGGLGGVLVRVYSQI